MQKKVPQTDIHRLNDQLASLEAKRTRILDAYFDGTINGTERDTRTKAVDSERETVRNLIARQKPSPAVGVETLANLFSVFREFDMLNREEKRKLLNTITPSIIVADYKVRGLWIGVERSDDCVRTYRD